MKIEHVWNDRNERESSQLTELGLIMESFCC